MKRRQFALAVFLLILSPFVVAAEFTRGSAFEHTRLSHPQVTEPAVHSWAHHVYPAINYAERDGVSLRLTYVQPTGPRLNTCVMIIHGGGWDAGSPEMEMPLAAALAEKGYTAALVQYRLGPAGRFPAAVLDLLEALRYLRSHAAENGYSPDRIVVCGASAGGQLASWLGAVRGKSRVGSLEWAEPVHCLAVVNIDGLVDFTGEELLRQQETKPSAPTRFLGGSFAERGEIWKLASPLSHVGKESAPTLFLRSSARSPVLPGRDRMVASLSEHSIPVQTKTFPNSPHTFWLFEPWFSEVVSDLDQFVGSLQTNN